jgi:hypothetical protein
VVGVSNVFAVEGGADRAWPVVLDAVHRLFPTLPVVGYANGAELDAAIRHGFEAAGPLRVWLPRVVDPRVNSCREGFFGRLLGR